MSGFIPKTPFVLQIRKIIYENFNEDDLRFNNDQIFEIIRQNGDIDSSWIIDNLEEDFKKICDDELVRCIAQNFTTQWYKLFDIVEKQNCKSCNQEIFIGKEEKTCPNPSCGASI